MRVSSKWLNEYIDIDTSIETLADKMLMVGNEAESIYKLSNSTNIVVGYVLDKQPHPDSDHLNLCDVDLGDNTYKIVCGAPNVDKGQKVIVAKVGSTLPGGVEIKKVTIRDVESNGMICSLEELGIESKYIEEKGGIHVLDKEAPIGEDALKYLNFDDIIVDYAITANRGDLLSIIGMAYEVGAVLNKKIKKQEFQLREIDGQQKITIKNNTEKCSAYLSRIVKDVVVKDSPNFIKARLIASGIRPINNIVDISNYVMLEYGQPLHFFDFDKLDNEIIIRESEEDEIFTTLDNIERKMLKGDILITNNKEILAVAGVMGGLSTQVTKDTKNILIESAIFDPLSIRKASKNIFRSESSIRFEKGIDPAKTEEALNKAAFLLQEYADAKVTRGIYGFNNNDLKDKQIIISREKANSVLGMQIDLNSIKEVFDRLDFQYELNGQTFKVFVPKRRLDLNIEEDLIEEIGRIYGYDNMLETLPVSTLKEGIYNSNYNYIRNIHKKLRSIGLNEIITYSLQGEKDFSKFTNDQTSVIKLLQPMSDDRNTLRYSLIPSLLKIIDYNLSRNNKDINVYEIGKGYFKEDSYIEENKLCIAIKGTYLSNNWQQVNINSNFYLLKGIIENLFEYLGFNNRYKFINEDIPKEFHPGKSSKVLIDNILVGYVGQVNPNIIKEEIYTCELNIDMLLSFKVRKIKYKEVSKYPTMTKDLSFIFDENINSIDILNTIKKSNSKAIEKVEIFDLYKDPNLGENKISLGFSITFMDQLKTLTDEEITIYFNKIIEDVLNTYKGSKLRDK